MKLTVQLVVALMAAVMVVSPASAQLELLGCPAVEGEDDNATFFANPYNCSTYYVCEQGYPTLMPCPVGTHFNDLLKVCDHPKDANCFELPPPLIEAPTTEPAPEEQPLTEKVVIIKTKKVILRPVDPEPEAEPAA